MKINITAKPPQTRRGGRRKANKAKYTRRARAQPARKNRTGAPVVSSLLGKRIRPSGVFAPSRFHTNDLLDAVTLSQTMSISYSTRLSPQDLPPQSRGKRMSELFAKYRPINVTFRIESAVPTSAGGQYAAFFDPNPSHDWSSSNAIQALTSMPAQGKAAAWECLEMKVPSSELDRGQELWTNYSGPENLVTRFGQLIILCLVAPNTTPVGSAEVTVWMEADWEFYEPNANSTNTQEPTVYFSAGAWKVEPGGQVDPNGGIGSLVSLRAYRCYPALPGELFVDGETREFIGVNGTDPHAFGNAADAQAYATTGTGPINAGTNTNYDLPAVACIPISGLGQDAAPLDLADRVKRLELSLEADARGWGEMPRRVAP